ncbi:MAG: DUF4974 domain-containing protein [Cyclobacteriaceae bacterium]|nr:DUF4974 domain-containing protein [Cyclobacteriaceae bacterium]
MKEVVRTLEQWYGVTFVLDGYTVTNKTFKGKYENEVLENVLRSIGFAMDFNFKIDGKRIYISNK